MDKTNLHPDTIEAIEEDIVGHGCIHGGRCDQADTGCKNEGCYNPKKINKKENK